MTWFTSEYSVHRRAEGGKEMSLRFKVAEADALCGYKHIVQIEMKS
jgi:hypothetical protein